MINPALLQKERQDDTRRRQQTDERIRELEEKIEQLRDHLVHIESELVGHGENYPQWRVRNALGVIREAYELVGIQVDTPDTRRQHRNRAKKYFANFTDDHEEAPELRRIISKQREEIKQLGTTLAKIATSMNGNPDLKDWQGLAEYRAQLAENALDGGGGDA